MEWTDCEDKTPRIVYAEKKPTALFATIFPLFIGNLGNGKQY